MVNFSLPSFTCFFIYYVFFVTFAAAAASFFFFLPSWGLNNYHDCILFSSLTQLQEEINRKTDSGRCEYTIFFPRQIKSIHKK